MTVYMDALFDEREAIERAVAAGSYGDAVLVDCARCDATAGDPCKRAGSMRFLHEPHAVRVAHGVVERARRDDAKRQAERDRFPKRASRLSFEPGDPLGVGCPECHAGVGQACDPWERNERCHGARVRLANQIRNAKAWWLDGAEERFAGRAAA